MGVKALVLCGDGINCERELRDAFIFSGAESKTIHVNEVLEHPEILRDFDILGFPGGFSFGDELRSGKILAEKIRFKLLDEIKNFVNNKKLIIGICNGFQVLMQLGAFENFSISRQMTLTTNDHGKFLDFWTKLSVEKTSSPWFQGLLGEELYLPARHKEGRILQKEKNTSQDIIALRYKEPINGSWENTAGLIDKTGQILGLMPHPEVALFPWLYPYEEGVKENIKKVSRIFENAVLYSKLLRSKGVL